MNYISIGFAMLAKEAFHSFTLREDFLSEAILE